MNKIKKKIKNKYGFGSMGTVIVIITALITGATILLATVNLTQDVVLPKVNNKMDAIADGNVNADGELSVTPGAGHAVKGKSKFIKDDKNYSFEYYSTLDKALQDANANTLDNADTTENLASAAIMTGENDKIVRLLKPATLSEVTTLSGEYVVDLNENTITFLNNGYFNLISGADIKISDSGNNVGKIIRNASAETANSYLFSQSGANLTIEYANLECTGENSKNLYGFFVDSGNLKIDGKATVLVKNNGVGISRGVYTKNGANMRINGATINVVAGNASKGSQLFVITSNSSDNNITNCSLSSVSEKSSTAISVSGENAKLSMSDTDISVCAADSLIGIITKKATNNTVISNCFINTTNSGGIANAIQNYGYMELKNSKVTNDSLSGGAIYTFAGSSTNIVGCEIFTNAHSNSNNDAVSIGVANRGNVEVSKSKIKAVGDNKFGDWPNAQGISSTVGTETYVSNCEVYALREALSLLGDKVTINGGYYAGIQHGGAYFSAKDCRVKNATFTKWTNSGIGYLISYDACFYVGSPYNEVKVYVDNCKLSGYRAVLSSNYDLKNTYLYISNSEVDKPFRVDGANSNGNKGHLYIGKNVKHNGYTGSGVVDVETYKNESF